MIKRILNHELLPDLEILRTVSEPVENLIEAQEIAKDLIDTLGRSDIGVGLSAPQIGVNKRVFVINRGEIKNLVFVNPEIVRSMGRMKLEEGCLSVPKVFKRVKRKQWVTVRYLDLNWNWNETEFYGFEAVIIQHECDHLDGILFIDEQ